MCTVFDEIEKESEVKGREALEAMEEARRISKDPNAKRYGSFTEVLEDFYNPVNQ